MRTIETRQGDTFDIISYRLYGSSDYMDELIAANIEHRKTVMFEASVVLNAPSIDTKKESKGLPPWKRSSK